MPQNLIDEIPDHLREFTKNESQVDPQWELIFYKKLDPEYFKIARSHYWDVATDYAIFRVDDAKSGLVVCARYPSGWDVSPGNRAIMRLLLGLLGVELPMPSMREEL